MYSNSILTRKSDGLKFRVVLLSHWSDIQSIEETPSGFIKDSVKWMGDNQYIGANSGESYIWKDMK